jgi:hypothetical protein
VTPWSTNAFRRVVALLAIVAALILIEHLRGR